MNKTALPAVGGGSAARAGERSKPLNNLNNLPHRSAQQPPNPNTASSQAELVAYLRNELPYVADTDGVVVANIVDWVIYRVISALVIAANDRPDGSLPERTRLQWEVFFYEAAHRAVCDLRWLRGLIKPEQAISAVEDFLTEHTQHETARPEE